MPRYEAVTVCCGYADFLVHVAPRNRPIFDRWLIVTTPDDEETRDVARRFSLEVLLSEDGTRDEAEFAKGRLIERGLQHLANGDAWRIHIDADMVLPAMTRHLFEMASLQTENLYGIDRIMCKSWEHWQEIQQSGWLHNFHDYQNRVRWPGEFQPGSRWASYEGYCPLGAFQMWHGSQDIWRGARVRRYNGSHNDACRTDIQFSLSFDRHRRVLIPELIAVHLESQAAPLGANWKGRQTRRFGPPKVENAKNECPSGS